MLLSEFTGFPAFYLLLSMNVTHCVVNTPRGCVGNAALQIEKGCATCPNHYLNNMCLGFELDSGLYAFVSLKSLVSKLGHSEECFKMKRNIHIMET